GFDRTGMGPARARWASPGGSEVISTIRAGWSRAPSATARSTPLMVPGRPMSDRMRSSPGRSQSAIASYELAASITWWPDVRRLDHIVAERAQHPAHVGADFVQVLHQKYEQRICGFGAWGAAERQPKGHGRAALGPVGELHRAAGELGVVVDH